MSTLAVFSFCFVVCFSGTFLRRTVVFSHDVRAFVTFHRAAPVKFAITAADDFGALLRHSEAAFVAQPATASSFPPRHAFVPLQALPSLGALVAEAPVPDAVVRGVLEENELRPRDVAEGVRNGASVIRAVASLQRPLVYFQLLGLRMLIFQVSAHLSEVGQLHPACLDAAASRYPVTFACSPHGGFDCLKETERSSS